MGTDRTGPPRSARYAATTVALAAVVASCATPGATTESTPSTTDAAQKAAFEFVDCMRSSGISDFPDPQVNGPGDIVLSPPVGVPDEELAETEAVCEEILGFDGRTSGSMDAGESGWEKLVPGGDCECADGSEFAFWERRADPTRVVLYLDGGGICFDAGSCAFTAENADFYQWDIMNERPEVGGGIFDYERADNPFADFSFVWVHCAPATRTWATSPVSTRPS